MKAAKEFGTIMALVAAILGIAYAAISSLPWWCLAAYVGGVALVGGALWRNSK